MLHLIQSFELTKYIEIDCHFVCEDSTSIAFTNVFNGVRVDYICNMVFIINIYASSNLKGAMRVVIIRFVYVV